MTSLQNHKCFGCKFCLWYSDHHSYYCSIKGCWENSKYVEYKFIYEKGENKHDTDTAGNGNGKV